MNHAHRWYREPTMMLVIGVLSFTFVAGFCMLGVALTHNDTLVLSAGEYQAWRDQMRATGPEELRDD